MVSQVSSVSSVAHITPDEVLIVEDEQSSRRALSLLLCSCGFRPQTFRTAEEALLWLHGGGHPHTALIDLDLPGIDGIDLIGRLKTLSPMTRSVLVTATDELTLARRIAEHPIPYLRKPIDFQALLGLLNRLDSPPS
jgi:DNA-binding NtrC family response regulator